MQTNQMKNTAHKRSNTVVLLVIAALLVLVMIFLPEREPNEPQYELTIRELGATCLMLDNDPAGRSAAERIYHHLQSRYEVSVKFPTFGKDFNDHITCFLFDPLSPACVICITFTLLS